MLKNSRVTGTLDTGRLGAALRGPGMDTRIWVSLAIVKAVHVDAEEGVFVDVLCVPLRHTGTARLGCEYAGSGFGMYAPLEVDDEVLVEAPSGDPDEGLVVTRRLHSASDPPPSEVVDHPEDVLLVVKPGRTVRIVTSGGGKVKLGGADADDPVALKSDLDTIKPAIVAAVDAQITVLTAGLPGTADALAEMVALKAQLEAPLGWPVCSQKVDAE